MSTAHPTREAGVALIAVLLVLCLLMALAVGLTTTINMDRIITPAGQSLNG